jgi:formylglycine-generating enzyme required for sulfatase activity
MNTRTLLILFLACAIARADHTMTIVQTSSTTTAYAASEIDSVTVAGDADGGVLTVYAGSSEKLLPTSTIVSMVFANDAPSDTPDGFVHIACAGKTFTMGTDSVQYNWGNVNPAHDVTLTKNFYIAKYEVTQQQFDELMKEAYPEAYTTPAWEEKYGIGPDLPAYYPSWYDAVLYCNAYTRKMGSTDTVYTYTELTGPLGGGYHDNPLLGTRLTDLRADFSKSGYRLPTEAEWCYAFLGGTTGP